jgi:hypothetical protein
MRFAPARAEAFKRAQEPDRLLASPATTRGVLFLSRRRSRGPIGPRDPTSRGHWVISPYFGVRFPSSRVIDSIPDHPRCGAVAPATPDPGGAWTAPTTSAIRSAT